MVESVDQSHIAASRVETHQNQEESSFMKPVLQALVLADHIYVDGRTGKKVIAGTFNRLWAKTFPSQLGRTVYAYICLTDVQGPFNLQLRYVELDTNQVLLGNQPVPLSSDDRLASLEVVVEVPSLPMRREGVCALELYAGDDLLGALRLTVSKLGEGASS